MPSTWIPDAELTQMRADAENTLPQSAIIARLSETSDSQGGMAQSFAAVGTVDARLVAKSGNVRAVAGAAQAVGSYTLTVPHDTDIQAADRVTVDSVNYRVLFVSDAATWRAAVRCDVELET